LLDIGLAGIALGVAGSICGDLDGKFRFAIIVAHAGE
jgi:hypothetical protein